MKDKFDDDDYVVFKGNSRPRIIAQVSYDKGDWNYVNCTHFDWRHKTFSFGSIRRSLIFDMATTDEITEYKALHKLFGEGGDLYHVYLDMDTLTRALQDAYHSLEDANKQIKELKEKALE